MEFKGTKGNWSPTKDMDDYFYKIKDNKGNGVVISSFECDIKERKANALLISKAPEMLEMLKEFLEMHREYDMRPEDELYEYADKVEHLIKQATQL